jgi:manganese efflux pump family protein
MSPFTIAALAVGMSIDAFVASVSRGAGLKRPPLREAVRTGIVFGAVEAITPLIGWLAGVVASQYVQTIDHWIAFTLLAIVGGRMAMEGFSRSNETGPSSDNRSLILLMATAVGTSIDAMAVGVSLAFLDVNIVVVAIAIGFATFAMSTGGMLLSRLIGPRFGKWAEVIGGIGLIALGASILYDHLTA